MKNIISISKIFVLIFLISVLFSCKKEAGEGGSSSLYGHLWIKDYNDSFTLLNGEYDGMDEDVYIIYGEEKGYSDRTRTNYMGVYQFKYLRPGKYTIYVYSKDSTLLEPSGKTAVVRNIEITDSEQDLEVPEIIIFK